MADKDNATKKAEKIMYIVMVLVSLTLTLYSFLPEIISFFDTKFWFEFFIATSLGAVVGYIIGILHNLAVRLIAKIINLQDNKEIKNG